MTDRKTIKVPTEVYEDLRDQKGQYETWAGLLSRLIDDEDDEDNQ